MVTACYVVTLKTPGYYARLHTLGLSKLAVSYKEVN